MESKRIGPLLFDSLGAAALIHAAVGHTFEADNWALHGTSQELTSPGRWSNAELFVTDRPDADWSVASYSYDDEGSKAQPVDLIAAGEWTGSLLTCRSDDVEPFVTGHGRRDSAGNISPRNSVLTVRAGSYSDAELRDMCQGGFECVGPRAAYSVGSDLLLDFHHIRPLGEVGGPPLRGARLVASKRAILRAVQGVGDEVTEIDQFWMCDKNGGELPVGFSSPSICLSACEIIPIPTEERGL